MQPSDGRRVSLVARRDAMAGVRRWEAPEEFDEFIRSRHDALLRFAHLLTGDLHTAADLVQESLERAGLRWRRILNAHLNYGRRRRRERLVAETPEVASADREPRDEALWLLLAALPRQQRAVLVLRFYEDLTEAEIARILGCSVGTVKSNSSRALARLRAALPGPAPSGAAEISNGGEHR